MKWRQRKSASRVHSSHSVPPEELGGGDGGPEGGPARGVQGFKIFRSLLIDSQKEFFLASCSLASWCFVSCFLSFASCFFLLYCFLVVVFCLSCLVLFFVPQCCVGWSKGVFYNLLKLFLLWCDSLILFMYMAACTLHFCWLYIL